MSSRALASALFGYGADIKVKNLVLELFFSILPTVYLSKYKLLTPSDELVVDYFFEYVKETLAEREELSDVSAALLTQTFPDITLSELSDTEIKLLADVAIKRIVYRALEKISERLYEPETGAPASEDKKEIYSVEDIFNQFFVLEPSSKLSVLDSSGNVKDYLQSEITGFYLSQKKAGSPKIETPLTELVSKFPAQERKFFREQNPSQPTNFYDVPRVCFEPYLRIKIKSYLDIRKCIKANSLNNPAFFLFAKSFLRTVYDLYGKLSDTLDTAQHKDTLNKIFAAEDISEIDSELYGDLSKISNADFVCSPEDFKAVFPFSSLGTKLQQEIADYIFESISVGIRCSVDYSTDSGLFAQVKQQKPSVYEKGYAEKSFSYEMVIPKTDKSGFVTLDIKRHFTFIVGESEIAYNFSKFDKALEVADGFAQINLQDFLKLNGTPADASPTLLLMIDLMKKKEVDALIKSLFSSPNLINLLFVAPNVEISKAVVDIMRKNGAFKGIDDGINEMFSSLKGYLSGDFPWSADCESLSRLL